MEKMKSVFAIAARIAAVVLGCAAIFFLLWLFMWACYYAGVPM